MRREHTNPHGDKTIFVVDDSSDYIQICMDRLRKVGYRHVEPFLDGDKAIGEIESRPPSLVLLDWHFGAAEKHGPDIIRAVRSGGAGARVPIIVLTASGDKDDIHVEALKAGANDFMGKDADRDVFLARIEKEFRLQEQEREIDRGRELLKEKDSRIEEKDEALHRKDLAIEEAVRLPAGDGWGMNLASRDEIKDALKILDAGDPNLGVLLLGEIGTGKSFLARTLHAQSNLRGKPFVERNCANFHPTLVKSELFGHFENAIPHLKAQKGAFEIADGGVLFLDEVARIPKEHQGMLLTVLEQGTIEKIGHQSDKAIKVKVQVICATNEDLEREVREGRFEEALFSRIGKGATIRLRPLRERKEEIYPLAEEILASYAKERRSAKTRFGEGVREALVREPWKSNVRGLKAVIESAFILGDNPDSIELEDLRLKPASKAAPAAGPSPDHPPQFDDLFDRLKKVMPALEALAAGPAPPPEPPPTLPQIEEGRRAHVLTTVARRGSVRKAAVELEIVERTLYDLVDKYRNELAAILTECGGSAKDASERLGITEAVLAYHQPKAAVEEPAALPKPSRKPATKTRASAKKTPVSRKSAKPPKSAARPVSTSRKSPKPRK